MRVIIYDSNPGPGFMNALLALSWRVGAWIQKKLGIVDDVYGFDSVRRLRWIMSLAKMIKNPKFTSVQFWGHGCPGYTFIAGQEMTEYDWTDILSDIVVPGATVWFRTCSTFQGALGKQFARGIADSLGVKAAGHTRTIGVLQGGLHTCTPNNPPTWRVEEGYLPGSLAKLGLKWGDRTVFFWTTEIPKGW